jgi:hypothetical protein
MLALKRPDLIPACDAQLVASFQVKDSSDAGKAVALMQRFRAIAAKAGNLDALAALKERLAERELFGHPINLSTTRILEALCWMETDKGYRELWQLLGWQ